MLCVSQTSKCIGVATFTRLSTVIWLKEAIHKLQGLGLRWHHVHAALVTQRERETDRVLARERERESDNDRQSVRVRERD